MKWLIVSAVLALSAVSSAQQPSDALPSGTYKDSCRNCRVSGGYLICGSCKTGERKEPWGNSDWNNDVSLRLDRCPEGPIWNDKGTLRCGDG